MKTHLVTGATGFVGKYLTNVLLEKGENVWIVVRSANNKSAQARAEEAFPCHSSKWPDSFRVIEGDIMIENLGTSDALIEELKARDVTFWHLAANLSFSSEQRALAQETNYTGTVHVVDLANKIAKDLMHMSTAYVCGDSPSFTEKELYTAQKFRNHYEKSKFEGEKYVRENCRSPYIIFRPSVIIGDAYKGKAEGCTFGYYRYMFMFHFFKKNVIKILQKDGRAAFCLKMLGTRYCSEDDTLKIPWLVIPYPKKGHVDLVTVDYVIESMIVLYEKGLRDITVHLTHHKLTTFHFLLTAALYDLGFRRVKFVPVPIWMYSAIISCSYFLAVPFRMYVKSVLCYVPYFTRHCRFDRSVAEYYLENPPNISRELIARVNTYAKEHILEHIKV